MSLDEVEQELAAQIGRLRAAGVPLTHLDAHKHVHLYPPVFAIVARLAARFGIPVVRVPYERGSWLNAVLWTWARRNPFVGRHIEPDRRIDYIFAGISHQGSGMEGGAGTVEDARVVLDEPDENGVFPSDHFALVEHR